MPFKKPGDTLTNIETGETFTLTSAPTNQNAGKCLWAIGTSNKTSGHIFLKQYLSPKGPSKMASEDENARRATVCDKFKKEKREVFNCIKSKSHDNIIAPIAFFQENASFFAAYPLKVADQTEEVLNSLNEEEKLQILLDVTAAVSYFQSHNLIHSDIKPTNLIITKSPLRAYLIDYDGAYFVGQPPEEVEGDFVYRSPEMIAYNSGDSSKSASLLTLKSDIFSLGVLFYRILSGAPPKTHEDSHYMAQALIDGKSFDLTFATSVDERLQALIKDMLALDALSRPNINMVQTTLLRVMSGDHSLGKEIYTSILSKLGVVEKKLWKKLWKGSDDGYELREDLTESQITNLAQILSRCALSKEEQVALNDFKINVDTSYSPEKRGIQPKAEVSSTLKIKLRTKPRW